MNLSNPMLNNINELIVNKFMKNSYYPSIGNKFSIIPKKLGIPIRIPAHLLEVECDSIVIHRDGFYTSFVHKLSNIVKEEDISYFIIKTYATNL